MRHASERARRSLTRMAAVALLPAIQLAVPPPPPPPPPPIPVVAQPSARGTPLRVTARGTASISGTVTTGRTPARALRRVVVRIRSVGDLPDGLTAITGDDGTFAFAGLPAGRYMVTASRPGFIETSYGAKRPQGEGSAIELADGQRVTSADLSLPPAAAIAGIVRDQEGEPMADQMVFVLRYAFNNAGQRSLQPARGGSFRPITDDRGAYRAWGLPPGEYYVVVLHGFDVRGGSAAHEVTADDVRWARQAVADRNRPPGAPPSPASEADVVYAPVFYPGTARQADASRIVLGEGEERTGIDVVMTRVPVADVHGTIVSPDGPPPANLRVSLLAHDRIDGIPFSGFTTATATQAGTFTLRAVRPGDYTIAVQPAAGPPPGQRGPGRPDAPGSLARFGLTDVTVTVTLQSGVTVSGRVSFEGATAPPPGLTAVRALLRADTSPGGAAIGVAPATVAADGTFSFGGVAPGQYRLVLTRVGNWVARSAMLGGRDVLDEPFTVASTDVRDLAVAFTDRPAELSGVIQDANGHPAPEYAVIAFAADERYWTPQSRRVQMARPGSDGRFRFPNLVPGNYLLVALTDVEAGEWYDPEFLKTLQPSGIPIAIGEGEHRVQDFRVAR
jgi:protocatechuate 3,4-dioxygenase beta subunit